jgi:hypothetical protein
MIHRHSNHWSRREFLTNFSLAGTTALERNAIAAAPPLETTKLRLAYQWKSYILDC